MSEFRRVGVSPHGGWRSVRFLSLEVWREVPFPDHDPRLRLRQTVSWCPESRSAHVATANSRAPTRTGRLGGFGAVPKCLSWMGVLLSGGATCWRATSIRLTVAPNDLGEKLRHVG